MIRYYWICIYLFVSFSSSAQFTEGDKFFRDGEFLLAALEYEKDFFENKDPFVKNQALLKKALSYKAISEYAIAVRSLSRIRRVFNDSLRAVIDYERVFLNYMDGNYQEAKNRMLRRASSPLYQSTDSDIILSFLIAIELLDWKDAFQLLEKESSRFGLTKQEISYIRGKKKAKDPDKAYNLSLLPGIGQLYAGYFWKGMLSGGIQAVLGAFSIYSLIEGYPLTGTFSGVAGFYTFYLGGARHARQLAETKNQELITQIKQRFFEVMQQKTLQLEG